MLARIDIISDNTKWRDLLSGNGIKSIGKDLNEQEVMSLRAVALVTGRNDLMEEPVKGRSDKGSEFGKEDGYCLFYCFDFEVRE